VCIPDIDFASGLADGAWLLYGLVYCMEPAICVEIGSARGLSACYMGMALKRLGKGKLYAIDPHTATKWNDSESVETYEIMRSNLKAFGVEQYVKIIRKRSADASAEWCGPIDLLFIDGDHSYDGVRRDWELFSPLVSAFGIVVFHDTLWGLEPDSQRERPDMGVPLFVEELRKRLSDHYCQQALRPEYDPDDTGRNRLDEQKPLGRKKR
jgi:predicted O-methyltransferase YrrM